VARGSFRHALTIVVLVMCVFCLSINSPKPMRCMRDWKTEDEGICVLVSAGMPCLMNNFLGDCGTMLEAPNSYCVEGTCRQPPSFPGDHCYIAQECTGGATCVNNQCVGVPLGNDVLCLCIWFQRSVSCFL
jgi:hypothetical protein